MQSTKEEGEGWQGKGNTRVASRPYMESIFEEVLKALTCPHLSVCKAAHEALGQFCCD